MKNLTYKLKISFLLVLLFCLMSPYSSSASVQYSPPVEKEKAHKVKKKQAKENKRLLKRQTKLKKITDDGYGVIGTIILLLFLLSIAALTGIILLIVGLTTANPVLWIVGLALIGIALLTFLIWLLVFSLTT